MEGNDEVLTGRFLALSDDGIVGDGPHDQIFGLGLFLSPASLEGSKAGKKRDSGIVSNLRGPQRLDLDQHLPLEKCLVTGGSSSHDVTFYRDPPFFKKGTLRYPPQRVTAIARWRGVC